MDRADFLKRLACIPFALGVFRGEAEIEHNSVSDDVTPLPDGECDQAASWFPAGGDITMDSMAFVTDHGDLRIVYV